MKRFLNYFFATGFGSGYSPLAPGTAGSIVMLLGAYFLFPEKPLILLAVISAGFWIGVVSGTFVENEKGNDPSIVVMDEIVGMGISLLFLPRNWLLYLIAFGLFRLFDIRKPPPIDALQKVKGGWGIMLDDVLAGVYALIGVQLIRVVFF